ncbi:MAG: nucleoside 2-deoxyribosyltransferase, partial [Clostridia bacterium]
MKQYIHNTKDTLYIAGPACFYQDGYELWHALRGKAEYLGYRVTMPTRVQLKLDHEDARKNADEIFANCVRAMGEANVLIADLEAFRGTEPDGGTVFEMGMAYALHHRIYAYTRDKRPLIHKLGTAQLMENTVVDLQGQPLPYGELPFCLCVMGCAKVFEGSFENALQLVAIDEEQAMVQRAWNKEPLSLPKTEVAPPERVFLFSPRFFAPDGEAWVLLQKHALERDGFTVVTPYDPADGEPSTPPATIMEKHLRLFGRWVRHVKSCGTLAVDLND